MEVLLVSNFGCSPCLANDVPDLFAKLGAKKMVIFEEFFYPFEFYVVAIFCTFFFIFDLYNYLATLVRYVPF